MTVEQPSSSTQEPGDLAGVAEAGREPHENNASGSDFELVVGRRQIASWLFVFLVVLGAVAVVSYRAGKLTGPSAASAALQAEPKIRVFSEPPAETQNVSAQEPEQGKQPASAVPSTEPAAPVVNATILNPPPGAIFGHAPAAGEPPIFQDPIPGAVYLQMGAVEKGMAVILAEGLRRHGFEASVAPGPSEKIFRVLIGPLRDAVAFARAKAEVDAIDLGTFARRYEKEKVDAPK